MSRKGTPSKRTETRKDAGPWKIFATQNRPTPETISYLENLTQIVPSDFRREILQTMFPKLPAYQELADHVKARNMQIARSFYGPQNVSSELRPNSEIKIRKNYSNVNKSPEPLQQPPVNRTGVQSAPGRKPARKIASSRTVTTMKPTNGTGIISAGTKSKGCTPNKSAQKKVNGSGVRPKSTPKVVTSKRNNTTTTKYASTTHKQNSKSGKTALKTERAIGITKKGSNRAVSHNGARNTPIAANKTSKRCLSSSPKRNSSTTVQITKVVFKRQNIAPEIGNKVLKKDTETKAFASSPNIGRSSKKTIADIERTYIDRHGFATAQSSAPQMNAHLSFGQILARSASLHPPENTSSYIAPSISKPLLTKIPAVTSHHNCTNSSPTKTVSALKPMAHTSQTSHTPLTASPDKPKASSDRITPFSPIRTTPMMPIRNSVILPLSNSPITSGSEISFNIIEPICLITRRDEMTIHEIVEDFTRTNLIEEEDNRLQIASECTTSTESDSSCTTVVTVIRSHPKSEKCEENKTNMSVSLSDTNIHTSYLHQPIHDEYVSFNPYSCDNSQWQESITESHRSIGTSTSFEKLHMRVNRRRRGYYHRPINSSTDCSTNSVSTSSSSSSQASMKSLRVIKSPKSPKFLKSLKSPRYTRSPKSPKLPKLSKLPKLPKLPKLAKSQKSPKTTTTIKSLKAVKSSRSDKEPRGSPSSFEDLNRRCNQLMRDMDSNRDDTESYKRRIEEMHSQLRRLQMLRNDKRA